MDRLWKWLMHADAKALFFGAVILFVVAGVVAWLRYGREAVPQREPPAAGPSVATEVPTNRDLGVLEFVTNQLSADAATAPVCPFRPDIDTMFAHQAGGTAASGMTNQHRVHGDPFAKLRPHHADTPAAPAIPVLAYRGYFQRPDGTYAALFHDSVDDSSKFFTPGTDAVLRGVSLLAADRHAAKVRLPSGETKDLAIGDTITLPAVAP